MLSLAILALISLPLTGADAERFLRQADVVTAEEIHGSAEPQRLTLSLEGVEARAIWKTVDIAGGTFRDFWGYEVAAYKLSKLLGLDIVPPTVRRTIGKEQGSLQLWMEDCETLADHGPEGVDVRQLQRVRAFGVITGNLDQHNANVLICEGGKKVYAIDASRAFQDRSRLYFFIGDTH